MHWMLDGAPWSDVHKLWDTPLIKIDQVYQKRGKQNLSKPYPPRKAWFFEGCIFAFEIWRWVLFLMHIFRDPGVVLIFEVLFLPASASEQQLRRTASGGAGSKSQQLGNWMAFGGENVQDLTIDTVDQLPTDVPFRRLSRTQRMTGPQCGHAANGGVW